jgi:hypothetical protein
VGGARGGRSYTCNILFSLLCPPIPLLGMISRLSWTTPAMPRLITPLFACLFSIPSYPSFIRVSSSLTVYFYPNTYSLSVPPRPSVDSLTLVCPSSPLPVFQHPCLPLVKLPLPSHITSFSPPPFHFLNPNHSCTSIHTVVYSVLPLPLSKFLVSVLFTIRA